MARGSFLSPRFFPDYNWTPGRGYCRAHQHGGSILGSVNLCKIFQKYFLNIFGMGRPTDLKLGEVSYLFISNNIKISWLYTLSAWFSNYFFICVTIQPKNKNQSANLTFLYYANEKSDDVIGGSTKTVQHSIKNICRNIGAVFFKLGTRTVHQKISKVIPVLLLPWQQLCRWSCFN